MNRKSLVRGVGLVIGLCALIATTARTWSAVRGPLPLAQAETGRGAPGAAAFRGPMDIPTGVALNPQSLLGGQTFTCTVTLSGMTSTDQVVQITTNQSAAFTNLPSSIVVPAGSSSASFQAQTAAISDSVSATITAACNGGQAQASLQVVHPD